MGKTGSSEVADINMTPMIDVLLVLLVIFMIAQPLLQKTMDVQLPKEQKDQTQAPPTAQIILQIEQGGVYKLNTLPIAKADLERRLTEIYRDRPQKVIFVKADPEIVYQDVIAAMDAARGAGVKVIGAVLPEQEAALGL
ncbi:MAG: ExbD/TolR family protein [Gemmatimonadota bacterium]